MSEPWTGALPFFARWELWCPLTKEIRLDPAFAVKLPALRFEWNGPLTLNSCCRSPEHNKAVRGHPRSLHMTKNPVHDTQGCMAADVAWHDWSLDNRLAFAERAWEAGFSLGLNASFCHIDLRVHANLDQTVFTYSNWTGDAALGQFHSRRGFSQ